MKPLKSDVFVSQAIGEQKLPIYTMGNSIAYGKAHYSWKLVANFYRRGLQYCGVGVKELIRPEIYTTPIARSVMGYNQESVHISVKPIEEIRALPGAKNVFIAGWEFPEFTNAPIANNPLFNQVSMLQHADQIWCWSDFTRKNLEYYGFENALTVPPPLKIDTKPEAYDFLATPSVPLDTEKAPSWDDIKPLGTFFKKNVRDKYFITVLNPFDQRKQFGRMLNAFLKACAQNRDIYLVVKLVIDNEVTKLVNINEILRTLYEIRACSDNIMFISETISDERMAYLLSVADFYLCTSSTEGLNMPLIEGVAQGLLPVSTNATAMADYINDENAIVLPYTHERTADANSNAPYHSLGKHLDTTHFPPTEDGIVKGILDAANLSKSRQQSLIASAKKTIRRLYSLDAFSDNLQKTILVEAKNV